MRSQSIKTLLLLASICLPSAVLAAALPRRSASLWQPDPIEWKVCSGGGLPNTVDCANLSVPLDWADSNGEKISRGSVRLRATKNASTENLVINPGGPGVIATEFVVGIASRDSEYSPHGQLRKHYNFIGPDPRGKGRSTPIKCDVDLWNERGSGSLQTEADFNRLVQSNKALGESCLKLSGDIVKYVDTTSVARDFDAIRKALGDEKLNFLAFSYGTQIAAQYAELFPQSVGRFVLDGILEHSGSETYTLVTEVATYENMFDRFAQRCGSSEDCALHGKDVAAIFDEPVKQADTTPIPAPFADGVWDRKDWTGAELRSTTGEHLAEPSLWPLLGLDIADALEGSADIFTQLAVAGEITYNSGFFGGHAVMCLDWPHSSNSISDILYKQQLIDSIAPHTLGASGSWGQQLGCVGWPSPIRNPPHRVNVHGAPPMLLVNSLYDPATSYTWVVSLEEQIPGAVLLTRNGYGNLSYDLDGESYDLDGEAHDVMDSFLLDGKLPARNTVVDS